MEAVIAVFLTALLIYVAIELLKKFVNSPRKKGGFPYSRNKRSKNVR